MRNLAKLYVQCQVIWKNYKLDSNVKILVESNDIL